MSINVFLKLMLNFNNKSASFQIEKKSLKLESCFLPDTVRHYDWVNKI